MLADAAALTLQFLRIGAETRTCRASGTTRWSGAPKGDPVPMDWTGKRSSPATITVQTGMWPTGLYAARLTTDDGRVGFAPFVLRAATPGPPASSSSCRRTHGRPTTCTTATATAGGTRGTRAATRPSSSTVPTATAASRRGSSAYDRAFLRWLATDRTKRRTSWPRTISRPLASGDDLRALYDLVVFSGHSEYMTGHTYDVIERFRDLGGRLIFLSADNFFWRVDKAGDAMRRIKPFRNEGRPEARIVGVQYRANDDGRRQGAYTVVEAEAAPWLFDKTGLATGSTFGETVGGYGIEIDATTPDSPPGTVVLARADRPVRSRRQRRDDLLRDRAGARVFAAGSLDFGGSATRGP